MKEKSEKKQLLSRDEVWSVLQFADSLYNGKSWLYGGGVYTPDILNSNLENLNNEPSRDIPTYEKVIKSLSNAVQDEDVLRSFSQYMSYFDTIYEKVANYSAFEKVPDTLWEEDYNKYMEVLNKYKDIRVLRWTSN